MRTNRKAEEKKMSMSKNIARLAVTAGLTAALSFGGVMAPVTMAFAEGAAGSTVTFNDPTYQETTTYKGIQIFTANVSDSAVTNIQWAGSSQVEKDAIRDVVVSAIDKAVKAEDSTKSYSSNNAQEAAEWLNEHAKTNEATKVASDNVLNVIAKKLNTAAFSGAWKATNQDNKSLSGLAAGYWLFLTDNTTKSDNESTDAFTSPVYAVIDGTNTTVTISPKKSVPTVEKKILDDDSKLKDVNITDQTGWEDYADSQIDQEVNYKLTGTIASNYATFSTYAYKFTDVLSGGLDYVDGSVEVYALKDGAYTTIDASKYDVAWANNTLTVDFKVDGTKKGLKDVDGLTADTKIVVFYRAKLNGSAVIGNSTDGSKGGNPNTVTLTYSNNPYTESAGTTIGDTVADFAFKLNLIKVDQGTEKGLAGAVFTIQSHDANTNGQYVASKADTTAGVVAGQLVPDVDANNLPDYVKFTSGDNGLIAVSGLDAGSYTVTEVKTPDDSKYTKADPFTFTITPTYNDSTMKVTGLEAEPSEDDVNRTDIAFCKLDDVTGDNVLQKDGDAQFDVNKGEIIVFVGNTKSVGLPLTGLNGVTFTWIAGGAVLCIGVAHLIRSRKQAEESEQE